MEEEGGRVSDWAWLPIDLLDSIVYRMVEFSDFIRFASVCKPWRLVAEECHRHPHQHLWHILKTCHNQLPMLLTSTEDNSDNNRTLHLIKEEEGVERCLQIQLPVPCSTRFIGSSQGWLFMVDRSLIITLIHPFLNKTLVLPKFELSTEEYQESLLYSNFDHEYNIVKAIILPHSYQNKGQEETTSLEVLLIYSVMGALAYLNTSHEDTAWKPIEFTARPSISVFSDIISYKGQVYAVSLWGALVHVDVTTRKCTILIEDGDVFADTTYLVESQNGDLLFITRFLNFPDENSRLHKTAGMGVSKLSSLHDKNPKWVPVRRIGEQSLFLGDNHSMSISTRDFPQYYKRNCIYYLDHYFERRGYFVPRGVDDDNGVFNMEKPSFKRFTYYTPDASNKPPSTPSIWIVPRFY